MAKGGAISGIKNVVAKAVARISDAVVEGVMAVMNRVFGRSFMWAPFPFQAENVPRYGFGKPVNPHLAAIFDPAAPEIRSSLETIAGYRDDLARVRVGEPVTDESQPYWNNVYMPGLDAAAIYSIVRSKAPSKYVEIGSGMSTRFANQARIDGSTETKIISIDPHPRVEIEAICDELVRAPLEQADLSVFDTLEAGDVVFMDGSHAVHMNNDVSVFFLDVVPALKPGVIVGIHDIFLPHDYPPDVAKWRYSEQYMLAAYLLGGAGVEVLLSTYLASVDDRYADLNQKIWDDPAFADVKQDGYSFWMQLSGQRRQDA